ncbi:9722_t:CDS:10, partial [Scutellospora calospora]
WLTNRSLEDLARVGHLTSLDEPTQRRIVNLITSYRCFPAVEVRAHLMKNENIAISVSTICYILQNHDLVSEPTIKFGSSSIMIWECFSSHGVSSYCKVDATQKFERRNENRHKRAHIKSYYYENYHKRINNDNIELMPRNTPTKNPKICIIGAGTSALLLNEAGIKNVTILEYQGRVGGRFHTHYFTEDPNDERRLYGELGAMRLPYIEVFDTIDYLNEYNKFDNPDKEIQTINFIYSNPNGLYYYNNKKDSNGKMITKAYSTTVNISQLGFPDSIPDNYVGLWNEALLPFFLELDIDFTKGLKALKRYDQYTAYSYLKEVFLPAKLPTKWEDYDEIISAIEMHEMGIGMQRLPNAFLSLIKKANYNLKYNSEVYKLEKTDDGRNVKVYWKTNGMEESDVFDRVVVTAPLGCVRHWDLPSTLSYDKRRVIRELDYLNEGRIFLQFKSRFWEKSPLDTGGIQTTSNIGIVGGTSSTDLPVRTVVYPSYYVGLPENGSGVLLASYTWDNDATKYSAYTEEERFELALKDIVTLHGEIARKEWIPGKENNKARYWTNDKTVAGGAYARYGAGQLEYLMGAMMRSEDFIHWAGEHTDIHNAWIVGALNSGVRIVKEILRENLMNDEWLKLKNMKLLKYWNGNLNDYKGY